MQIIEFLTAATDAVKSVSAFMTAIIGFLAILEKLVKWFFDDDTDTDADTRKG